eukprot:CAMPEP_0201546200 /NCGR_PEP_ID=MMETSP0173_2-20130828/2564_1 /ASSEMBLY_ACC=CAM_ASM_000268 /TAXON_ID=218659 /ORGANISM="Vexillifera sp., Strain DIVA3 564/2" /LENGTH=389 /DNA_ID=CAMNT_0047954807 /DNA_START=9 /DNA_END=1178 /DNA_ORIENTATION=-
MTSTSSTIIGSWQTKLQDSDIPITYHFKESKVFELTSPSSIEPTKGEYTIDETQSPARICIDLPIFVVPIAMKGIYKIESGNKLVIRYHDEGDVETFLSGPHKNEQFHFVKLSTEQIEKQQTEKVQCDPEYASLSEQDRRVACMKEFMQSSMNEGMKSMTSQDGLGGALSSVIGAAQQGNDGQAASNQQNMSSLASSNYVHTAINIGSSQAKIFTKYGFAGDEVSELMNDPELQQIAQAAMMESMFSMFSSGAGGDQGGAPNPLEAFAALLQEGQGGGNPFMGAPGDMGAPPGDMGAPPGDMSAPPGDMGAPGGFEVPGQGQQGFQAGMEAAMQMFQQGGGDSGLGGNTPFDMSSLGSVLGDAAPDVDGTRLDDGSGGGGDVPDQCNPQ